MIMSTFKWLVVKQSKKKKTVINKLECNASNMKQTTNKKSVL